VAAARPVIGSRSLLNLGLVALVIALLLVAYFRPGLEPEPEPQPITRQLDPAAVTTIHIERQDRAPLAFSKEGDLWYLTKTGGRLPAADFQVRALLRLLKATSLHSYPADSLELATLGLDPPRATVRIDALTVYFGTTDALERKRYVRIDDAIHLIDDQYQQLINAEWANFVSGRLLVTRGPITRLELPGMTLAYDDDRHWQLDPEQAMANADALQGLIDRWQTASALYVQAYSGSESAEYVTLHTRDSEEPLHLQVVSHTPDLILARPEWGIQYHLGSDMQASLLTLPEPLPEPETGSTTDPDPSPG
jgi:hypothetical protein